MDATASPSLLPPSAGEGSAPLERHVTVAVDSVGGASARPYTYAVPAALSDLAIGEAVLVEFGRRQAVGVVLADTVAPDGVVAKPIASRVRSDGPLLPDLSLALARSIADHYLAPIALVIRAMLPPGFLERLELVAERTPDGRRGEPDDPGRSHAPADANGPPGA